MTDRKSIVTEWLWPPIKRHIYYWWCFGDNIQGLREEIRHLERERLDVDQRIEEARLRAERPTIEIEKWSRDSAKKLEEATRVSQGCGDLEVWNIITRYIVGKNAKMVADGLLKLRKEANLIRIGNPAPPPSMVSISQEPTLEFDSRRHIEENIMECLNDDRVSIIAICGAGGVGKTTMVQRIMNKVRKDKLFDEVITIVVGQQIDMLKIQREVAELLGLDLWEDTLGGRAGKLHSRLMDFKRKIVIFDDVWKRFKLEEIGVPFGDKCKIILTSRVIDTCNKMNAQKIIPMEVLTEEEAWTLLKDRAGSYVDGSDLRPIAEAVAAECKGLPIALVTVGEALKDHSLPVWRDSLSQLRRSIPTDFPEVIEDIYKPLKLSYDSLKNECMEFLFLLCCLFPEDYNIPIECLTFYGVGIGMFRGIRTIEEGRCRTYSFVERLKSCFLLINGSDKNHVKIHDVIRDVAIFIGSKEKHGFLKSLEVSSMGSTNEDTSLNCNWMSTDISTENAKLLVGSGFPNLHLLMILDSAFRKISEIFHSNLISFNGLEKLNVLSISSRTLLSLPPSLKLLKNLRTLHLYECALKDISIIGELPSLEIICIQHCPCIEELPMDIRRFSFLKVLELNHCHGLERIKAGFISSLTALEELKIIVSFDKWEAKGNQSEEKNVGLSELESLRNLKSLEIEISDSNLVAEEIYLPQQLVRYRIHSGIRYSSSKEMEHEREITLNLPRYVTVGNWIHQLIRSAQSLKLHGDGSTNINLAEGKSLKKLKITECSTVKKLVSAINSKFLMLEHLELVQLEELEDIVDDTVPKGSISFEKLETLSLKWLPKFVHLWNSPNQNISVGNLQSITICKCPKIRYLLPVATVRSLVQLQYLEIASCDMIEQVFWNETERHGNGSVIDFPRLEELVLNKLPKLATFSEGVEIIEFPRLKRIEFYSCPKLITKIDKCPNLKSLYLCISDGLRLLSSVCTRNRNIKLETLEIRDCDSMEEILWDENKDGKKLHITFPELTTLELRDLPCLKAFCGGVESIKFPKLERIMITNLPRLTSFAPMESEAMHDDHSLHLFCNQKVEFPSLKKLELLKLQDIIIKIWCPYIPINFFHNLMSLYICDINGIRNLMSSSIAKNLVNLGQLCIISCREMIVVIEDEKEVFVTSLFPNLEWLYIMDLQKLKSFCQWKHAFELPSLNDVRIIDCSVMETFTLGSLRTLNLSKFKINDELVEMKCLNGGIQDRFRTKSQEGYEELKFPLRTRKRQKRE